MDDNLGKVICPSGDTEALGSRVDNQRNDSFHNRHSRLVIDVTNCFLDSLGTACLNILDMKQALLHSLPIALFLSYRSAVPQANGLAGRGSDSPSTADASLEKANGILIKVHLNLTHGICINERKPIPRTGSGLVLLSTPKSCLVSVFLHKL